MQPSILAILSLAALPQLLVAQITQGRFETFGSACAAPGGTVCGSHNPNGGTVNAQNLSNEYGYPFTLTSNSIVTGFELVLSSVSGVKTVPTAIYKATTGGAPETNPIATSAVTVENTSAFYRSNFNKLLILAPGNYFISAWCIEFPFKNPLSPPAVYASNLVGAGTTLTGIYWRRGSQTWALTGIVTTPAFKIICAGGSGPTMASTGVPEIGKNFTAYVNGRSSSLANLLLGTSKTMWGALNLPLGFGTAAPGCWLFVSADFILPTVTNSSGLGSVTLPVPNQKNLIGVDFFTQFMVSDPQANTLQQLFSNAAMGSIGGIK